MPVSNHDSSDLEEAHGIFSWIEKKLDRFFGRDDPEMNRYFAKKSHIESIQRAKWNVSADRDKTPWNLLEFKPKGKSVHGEAGGSFVPEKGSENLPEVQFLGCSTLRSDLEEMANFYTKEQAEISNGGRSQFLVLSREDVLFGIPDNFIEYGLTAHSTMAEIKKVCVLNDKTGLCDMEDPNFPFGSLHLKVNI